MKHDFRMAAPCLFGLEGLVADELRKLEAREVEAQNGRVLFCGDATLLARANLWLRCAERVEIVLGTFTAVSFEQLFEATRALPWEQFLGQDDAFPVKGWALDSALMSIPDCQAIVKKAVVERLKQSYPVEWFSEIGPVHQIRFSILKNEVTLMLDTSGAGLHKRGYRQEALAAPLKETLAAGMAKLARFYPDSTVYDPFCGSGTILIESALLARNMAPGLTRHFSAERWGCFDSGVWQRERARALDLAQKEIPFEARGADIDPSAVALANANAAKAGVAACVQAVQGDICAFERQTSRGVVITNPPYGERLLDIRQAERLYGVMGEVFEPARGWRYCVISPHEEFERLFGRRADKRRKLYNGMIRCQLYLYYKS